MSINTVRIPAGDSYTCAGFKSYAIYNCASSVSVQIVGGPNSLVFFKLLPLSGIIMKEPTITVNAPYGPATIEWTGLEVSEEIPIPPAPEEGFGDILDGKKFCLDAGHGGTDPGAVNSDFGLQEKVAALDIIMLLGKRLIESGAEVLYTRENNDTRPGLTARAQAANSFGADAFISVHLNSAENRAAQGTEVLVYSKSGRANTLAENILAPFLKATGFKDRGVKERPDLTVLAKTKMPAVLVETGFISNNEEAQKLFLPDYQIKMADAIYEGVVKTFV